MSELDIQNEERKRDLSSSKKLALSEQRGAPSAVAESPASGSDAPVAKSDEAPDDYPVVPSRDIGSPKPPSWMSLPELPERASEGADSNPMKASSSGMHGSRSGRFSMEVPPGWHSGDRSGSIEGCLKSPSSRSQSKEACESPESSLKFSLVSVNGQNVRSQSKEKPSRSGSKERSVSMAAQISEVRNFEADEVQVDSTNSMNSTNSTTRKLLRKDSVKSIGSMASIATERKSIIPDDFGRSLSMKKSSIARDLQRLNSQQVEDLQSDSTDSSESAAAKLRKIFMDMVAHVSRFIAQAGKKKGETTHWIHTGQANITCTSIILLNSAYIGAELDFRESQRSDAWAMISYIFLGLFACELILRVCAERSEVFKNHWNVFDACILSAEVILEVIFPLIAASSAVDYFYFGLFRMLRMLRILRVFRFSHNLLLIARGILGALKALVWAVNFILVVLYVCAIFVTASWGKKARIEVQNPENRESITEWWGTIGRSLVTLFQLMTLEDWDNVSRTCNEEYPVMWIFIVSFVCFTNYTLLNLVTAVVVENVLVISKQSSESAASIADKKRLENIKALKSLFEDMDRDSDGQLELEEWEEAMENPAFAERFEELEITIYEAQDLFGLLDLDRDGIISLQEFVEGYFRFSGFCKAKHLLALQYDLQNCWRDTHGGIQMTADLLDTFHQEIRSRLDKADQAEGCVSERGFPSVGSVHFGDQGGPPLSKIQPGSVTPSLGMPQRNPTGETPTQDMEDSDTSHSSEAGTRIEDLEAEVNSLLISPALPGGEPSCDSLNQHHAHLDQKTMLLSVPGPQALSSRRGSRCSITSTRSGTQEGALSKFSMRKKLSDRGGSMNSMLFKERRGSLLAANQIEHMDSRRSSTSHCNGVSSSQNAQRPVGGKLSHNKMRTAPSAPSQPPANCLQAPTLQPVTGGSQPDQKQSPTTPFFFFGKVNSERSQSPVSPPFFGKVGSVSSVGTKDSNGSRYARKFVRRSPAGSDSPTHARPVGFSDKFNTAKPRIRLGGGRRFPGQMKSRALYLSNEPHGGTEPEEEPWKVPQELLDFEECTPRIECKAADVVGSVYTFKDEVDELKDDFKAHIKKFDQVLEKMQSLRELIETHAPGPKAKSVAH